MAEMAGKLRLGIDVGGTFTHGVLLDAHGELRDSVKVPTTHTSKMGVAEGVAACLRKLLAVIEPESVGAVNHSTTQATNALLEGDLSPVSVHIFHRPGEGFLLRRQMGFNTLRISRESRVPVEIELHSRDRVPPTPPLDKPTLVAETIVDSDGELEHAVCEQWQAGDGGSGPGQLLQAATDISRLLGVKARVKTGILNCAMLPTMLSTLSYTQHALRDVAPELPLMVVKSDGGVMPAEVVFRKPLNCLLSGPAAGAAAALHFAGLTTGLFLEVGGTSTDISFIHQGRINFRPSSVGGHRLQIETLDLRTVALGGGSLIGTDASGKVVVGPRSAHLAGLQYLSFAPEEEIAVGRLVMRPGEGEGRYFAWELPGGSRSGFTLTDFANWWGVIPQDDEAYSAKEKLRLPFKELQKELKLTEDALARAVVARVVEKVRPLVREYVRTFKPERGFLRLVGGGGGVNSALPFISHELRLPYEVVAHYPQISAVGAALAASTVHIRLPSTDGSVTDIERARGLATEELAATGLTPEKAEFDYRFDASSGILRLTATAQRPFEVGGLLSADQLRQRARTLLGVDAIDEVFANTSFVAYTAERQKGWFGLGKYVLVLDRLGRSRLLERGCGLIRAEGRDAMLKEVERILEEKRVYRDAGEVTPLMWVIAPLRFHDLSTLVSAESCKSVLAEESATEGDYFIIWKLPES